MIWPCSWRLRICVLHFFQVKSIRSVRVKRVQLRLYVPDTYSHGIIYHLRRFLNCISPASCNELPQLNGQYLVQSLTRTRFVQGMGVIPDVGWEVPLALDMSGRVRLSISSVKFEDDWKSRRVGTALLESRYPSQAKSSIGN